MTHEQAGQPEFEESVVRSARSRMAATLRRAPSDEDFADFFAESWESFEENRASQAAIGYDVRKNFSDYILLEDDDVLIVNKPAGIISHATAPHEVGFAEIVSACRPGEDINDVNRLDLPTSGAMVFAKNPDSLVDLMRQFRDKEQAKLRKIYLALLDGEFPDASTIRVDAYLAKGNHGKMKIVDAADDPSAKDSLTFFTPLTLYRTQPPTASLKTLVAARIVTGRTHQIRVTAAKTLGMPVSGDSLYNPTRPLGSSRLMLHSYELEFRHPRTQEQHSVFSYPPSNFTENLIGLQEVRRYHK